MVTVVTVVTAGVTKGRRPTLQVVSPLPGAGIVIDGLKERFDMNLKVVTWALASSTAFLYLLCIAYGFTNPASGHMREFLVIVFPGFEWLTAKGFAIGFAKSFLYGALVGLVYVPIYNTFDRRFRR